MVWNRVEALLLPLPPWQFLKKGTQIVDLLLCVGWVFAVGRNFDAEVFVCKLDLKAVFDSIHTSAIMNSLHEAGLDSHDAMILVRELLAAEMEIHM